MPVFRTPFYLFLLLSSATLTAQNTNFETNPDFPAEFADRLFAPNIAKVVSSTFTGDIEQLTAIEDGKAPFPLSTGMLLTTGRYQGVELPNTELNAATGSDAQVPAVYLPILQPGDQPHDAAFWEVTFIPFVDTIRLRYSLASDEFPLYDCDLYNDMAAIFLEGPGHNALQNLAEIGSGVPLGVNNVFCQHLLPYDDLQYLIGFNGMSQVQERKIVVQPCKTYTIRFLIFDVRDRRYDSGLFLAPIDAPKPNLVLGPQGHVYLEGCAAKPAQFTFQWLPKYFPIGYTITGTATPGVDYKSNVPLQGALSGNTFTFDPKIIADTVPDEGEYILIHFQSLNPDCQLQYQALFYISEVDTTTITLCKPGPVPAFLPLKPADLSFENPATQMIGPDFAALPIQTKDFPYPYLISGYMIKDICLDAQSLGGDPLRLYLQSPEKQKLELSTGAGYQFQHNCFSPYADDVFHGGYAPPKARYRPEGYWASIGSAATTGTWNLLAKPEAGTAGPWTMTLTKDFLYEEYAYTWSNGASGAKPELPVPADTTVLTVKLVSDIMEMTLPVTVIPKIPVPVQVAKTVCPGFELLVHGQVFNANNPSGTVEVGDCDSLIQVSLTYIPNLQSIYRDTLCAGDTTWVNGTPYFDQSPNGVEVFPATDGFCDSVVTVILYFLPPFQTNLTPTLCAGETFTLNGVTYDAQNPSGAQTLTAASGCDSVVTVSLSFLPSFQTSLTPTLCAGETFTLNSVIYDAQNPSGAQILTAANGCDSVVSVSLNFLPAFQTNLTPTLCTGETFTLNGVVYDAQNPSGAQILTAANGCDSVVSVSLSFLPSFQTSLTPTLCAGETFTLNGVTYDGQNPAGAQILTAANGCDSVVTVSLNFLPALQTNLTPTLCTGATFTLNGITYNAQNSSGSQTLTATSGCDSVVTVSLSFLPAFHTSLTPTLCAEETFILNGVVYGAQNPAGSQTLQAAGGCDSIVDIQVTMLPSIDTLIQAKLCDGESLQVGGLTFDEFHPNGTVTLKAANGCDSLVKVKLSFWPVSTKNLQFDLCPGDSLSIYGLALDEAQPNGMAIFSYPNGCDSAIFFISLHFLPAYRDTVQATIQAGQSYTVGEQAFSAPGIYPVHLLSAQGCDSTVILLLDVVTATGNPGAENGLRVYPNPATDWLQLEMADQAPIRQVLLFDAAGRVHPIVWAMIPGRLDLSALPAGFYLLAIEAEGRWHFARVARLR